VGPADGMAEVSVHQLLQGRGEPSHTLSLIT